MPPTLFGDRPHADPDLRATLLAARQDPRHWNTPAGRALLAHATTALRPLALRTHADPADALSHAYEVWAQLPDATLADDTVDLWAYTRAAVRRSLDREEEAARKITSVAGIRRSAARDLEGFTSLDSIEVAYDAFPDDDHASTAPLVDPRTGHSLAALEHVLVMAGFTEPDRTALVDVFADLVTTAPSVRASLVRAESVRDMFATHLSESAWRALVEIILGTRAGQPGIIALAATGHPAPAMAPHISTRLMSLLSVAA
jgi:hypothetical protein